MTVWEKVLFTMSSGEIRTLTTTVKEEMDKEGKLAFDWRKAKRQKEEQNALQRQNERTAVEND
ncbi:hypothetical protein EW026_g1158 [Hermanssonia centrifuga]|uniref:Uncharacterized protein n=1 Tax=Hermanssonia centrifuga TaxID=98765 RepID=A0A4S4KSE0_9APHY|nr:hypothetical protein EW026_g1158 [Hermanssonia centrifuga]